MHFTEIHIHPIEPQGGMVAFAHTVLNGEILIGSIGIHEKLGGGYRITYPQKGKNYIFHPITKSFSKALETAIIDKAKTVLGKNNDRQHRSNT